MTYCSIDNCRRKHKGLGFCALHYNRFKVHGDPNVVMKNCGLRHGLANTTEHNSWSAMLRRCRNPNSSNYPWYGGRGITVCERWLLFENFINDMGFKPGPDYSLDRIDNEDNYKPENCRWVDKYTQAANRRDPKSNTSGYRGVSKSSTEGSWSSTILFKGKRYYLGTFHSPEKASKAYQQRLSELNNNS